MTKIILVYTKPDNNFQELHCFALDNYAWREMLQDMYSEAQAEGTDPEDLEQWIKVYIQTDVTCEATPIVVPIASAVVWPDCEKLANALLGKTDARKN